MTRILLVDGNAHFGRVLKTTLEDHGFQVDYCERAQQGLELLSNSHCEIVLAGIEFLRILKDRHKTVPVIVMTKQGTAETLVEGTILGAFDFVEIPLELDVLLEKLVLLIEKAFTISPPAALASEPSLVLYKQIEQHKMLGYSKPMLEFYKQIGKKAAKSDLPVLIQSETGIVNERIAHAVHQYSQRKYGPFVSLNCAALSESLLEVELFGDEPRAAPGVDSLRKGYFEYADSGTLFLDEIGDMPMNIQVMLLRALKNQQIECVGGIDPVNVDVRIVSAMHRDLQVDVRDGKFHEDLLVCLKGFWLKVPPLRAM